MYNYYRYYRHKAVPKVGLGPVVLGLLVCISGAQWVVWRGGRERVYESALYDEMWRAKARKVALEEGAPPASRPCRSGSRFAGQGCSRGRTRAMRRTECFCRC